MSGKEKTKRFVVSRKITNFASWKQRLKEADRESQEKKTEIIQNFIVFKTMKLRNLFAVALLFVAGFVQAQDMSLPQDKNVRVGKLPNGLTYYIRHNNYPEKVANYYIAQKVGSVQEEENQRGLAHLLEHMAFNGTEHFKDDLLRDYLQSIGVEYGRNLNAYTSTDQTVYYFTDVPSTRQTAVDSCMLILKDWSNGISLTEEAIEAERDVVHNEYRMRIVGMQKILEGVLPQMYPGSKYGNRFPIGLMSVIDGCSPETLRAYYRKWYRPDNQAVIVVGDIDVDYIEGKIKELFSGIQVPANAAKVEPVPVPDNDKGIYIVGKDKEQQLSVILCAMKHEPTPDKDKQSMQYVIYDFMRNAFSMMMRSRFEEESQKPDCPFMQAGASDGQFLVSRTMDALTLQVVPKDGKDMEALAAAFRELKRVKDFGFTATEYERARAEVLSQLEKAYNNREKTPSNDYCQEYVENFINAEPIVSIEDQYQLMQQIAPMIPVDVVNEMVKELISDNDSNLVCLAAVQEKDGKQYYAPAEMKKAIDAVRAEKLEAYVDNVKEEPLMAEMPQAGTIVKETENQQLGFKQLTLSNGVTVNLKKTDFNADQIIFSAFSEGGNSVFGKKDVKDLLLASEILSLSALGNFMSTDLQKALAGKQCSTDFEIGGDRHGLSGSTTPKDLETLMQLIHLDFTKVNKDEKAFSTMINMLATSLKTISLNNDVVFEDSVMSVTYQNNPFFRVPSAEDVEAISYNRVMEIWKELYSNAANFTFTFVGNYDEQQLRQYICQYIASLPSTGKKTLRGGDTRTFANGDLKNSFKKKMENPQAQAVEIWRSNVVDYTPENEVLTDVTGRMLDMVYNREIREKLSAAYHAGAESEVDIEGVKAYVVIKGNGKLNPDKAAEAIPEFVKGMNATIASPNVEDLNKVKQILLKQADVDAKTNTYWRRIIERYNRYGIDFHSNYKRVVEGVNANQVSSFLQNTILKGRNHIQVTMMPE